jgi:hypothetical protein
VDLGRIIDGDRRDGDCGGLDKSNRTQFYASAQPSNRSCIARGGGHGDAGTIDANPAGNVNRTRNTTDARHGRLGRADSTHSPIAGIKQPDLGMYDERAKDFFQ